MNTIKILGNNLRNELNRKGDTLSNSIKKIKRKTDKKIGL